MAAAIFALRRKPSLCQDLVDSLVDSLQDRRPFSIRRQPPSAASVRHDRRSRRGDGGAESTGTGTGTGAGAGCCCCCCTVVLATATTLTARNGASDAGEQQRPSLDSEDVVVRVAASILGRPQLIRGARRRDRTGRSPCGSHPCCGGGVGRPRGVLASRSLPKSSPQPAPPSPHASSPFQPSSPGGCCCCSSRRRACG